MTVTSNSGSILPSLQIDQSKSIITIKKMVLADKEVIGSFVGESIQPQIRIGGYELRLFIYENKSPQYQLILTNFNGKLIWFNRDQKGWFSLTNILSQRDVIDDLLKHPNLINCIEQLICVKETPLPLPLHYLGSVSSNRLSETHRGKAYCGDAIRRKIEKWR